jgi:hypothetical protein
MNSRWENQMSDVVQEVPSVTLTAAMGKYNNTRSIVEGVQQ